MISKLKSCILSIRWFEIAVRLGAPVIALLLTIPSVDYANIIKGFYLIIAFFFLWAHGYALNEWGGYTSDRLDPAKTDKPIVAGKISPLEMLNLSIIFAVISIILFTLLDRKLLIFVFIDIIIGVMYCYPKILLKKVPFMSLAALFIVSANDFMLGWLIFSPNFYKGLMIGIYFGILGLAGISYHEVGDHDPDKAADIWTNAVRFGKKKIFILGFILYTLSIVYFMILTYLRFLPGHLYPILLTTYPIYFYLFFKCLKKRLNSMDVRRFIKNYRILYGIIGIYMIVFLIYPHLQG